MDSLLFPTVTLLYFHLVGFFCLFCFSKSISNVQLIRKINLLVANKYDSSKGENSH